MRQLEAVRLKDEAEERVWETSLKKLYLNLSLCSLKQRKSQLALSNCRRVLELDSKNVKAIFRIGQVCHCTHYRDNGHVTQLSHIVPRFPRGGEKGSLRGHHYQGGGH